VATHISVQAALVVCGLGIRDFDYLVPEFAIGGIFPRLFTVSRQFSA